MKKTTISKILVLTLICISICVTLFGCSFLNRDKTPIKNDKPYVATFVVNGGNYLSEPAGTGFVSKPVKDPTMPCHKFVCWSTERNKNVPFDFSTEISGDITLYAYFVYDETAMSEEIESVSSTIVKVVNTYKEDNVEKSREGVGIVYHIQNGFCYTVTNCHTVMALSGQTESKITVYDKEGNSFHAKIFKGQNKKLPAIDSEYDLAVICFEYSGNVLKQNAAIDIIDYLGESVISIGSSKEVVATGIASDYKKIENKFDPQLSNIDFEVYLHDAIPNSDVKECLTYDMEMKLIGITYYSDNGVAYTIPTGRISMFLNEYLYG